MNCKEFQWTAIETSLVWDMMELESLLGKRFWRRDEWESFFPGRSYDAIRSKIRYERRLHVEAARGKVI